MKNGRVGFDQSDFAGDDDLWLYIGGKLAVDIGGVHPAVFQTITGADLMLLGLMENTVYSLDIFFAERHTTESAFYISTSFNLLPGEDVGGFVPEPSTWIPVGLGLAAIALKRLARN